MKPNPYDATYVPIPIRSGRKALLSQLGWSVLAFAANFLGTSAWLIRWSIPGIHPALGGPDVGKVLAVLAATMLGCVVLATAVFLRAIYTRNVPFGLCAIVPSSFALVMLAEFLMALL